MTAHEVIVRFLAGGALVALFAVAGEAFKTKTFSGLFGAAPSVAIVTLGLVLLQSGPGKALVEARSMALASAALLAYTAACVTVTRSRGLPVWLGAGLAYVVWLAVALGGWKLFAGAGVLG